VGVWDFWLYLDTRKPNERRTVQCARQGGPTESARQWPIDMDGDSPKTQLKHSWFHGDQLNCCKPSGWAFGSPASHSGSVIRTGSSLKRGEPGKHKVWPGELGTWETRLKWRSAWPQWYYHKYWAGYLARGYAGTGKGAVTGLHQPVASSLSVSSRWTIATYSKYSMFGIFSSPLIWLEVG
jgi:hypothetical protein